MDEKIKQQVCRVLEKYEKYYTDSGVLTNLESWQSNKGWLVELLRRHPNWNEDALAVVLEVTHSREIDRATVNLNRYELEKLNADMDMPEDDRNKFLWSLDAVTLTYSKTLPGSDTADIVKDYCGVTCSVGQKTSRIINAICKRYGLDKHPEYNARFAKLADSLNPMQVKRTALLSVHPCDYLEMSNRDNSWSSCHCLDAGEYSGGTLSYMNDDCSMIFYTVDDGIAEGFYTAHKRTRQVFCFNNGILLQSRLYPQTDDNETKDMYRNIVQRIIADCLMVPNLWTLKREQDEVNRRVITHRDALHYRDYEYKSYKPNISLLKSESINENDHILVGYTAYCIDCSRTVNETNNVYCDICSDNDSYATCHNCNHRLSEYEAHYIFGNYYCEDCCSYCEYCHDYTTGFTTEVQGSDGCTFYVCQGCLEDEFHYCSGCDKYFHRDAGHFVGDDFCCNDCFEEDYRCCDGCGEFFHIDDLKERSGKYYCSCCYENNRYDVEKPEEAVTRQVSA